MRRIVVSGCGRSGTAYFARALQLCGVRCGHEVVFGPHGYDWGDYEADSSWLAAPDLGRQRNVMVVHLVRDPLRVLRSTATFFRSETGPYHEAIRRAVPEVYDPAGPIDRFVRYWVHWNMIVEFHADLRVRIEDLDAQIVDMVLRQSGRHVASDIIAQALEQVPRNYNTHAVHDEWASSRTYAELAATVDASALEALARRYGYILGPERTRMTEIQCPICGERAVPSFEAFVRSRYTATYATCTSCGSLHVVNPHWHEEAHRDLAVAARADSGEAWRNATLARLLTTLAPLTSAGPWLDYGCGHGLLVAEMVSRGYDIVGYDPYHGKNTIEGETFSVVTCFEVLEHQLDPVTFMRTLAKHVERSGVIVLSTWLREPRHGRDWSYLATAAGQHVVFPSRAGFRALCAAVGLVWRMSAICREHEGLQVHIIGREPTDSPGALATAFAAAGFEPSTV